MLNWNNVERIDSSLSINTVVLWLARITEFYPCLTLLRSFLQNTEQHKADRFHFEIHQQRYTISQGLLRFLLADYLRLKPKEVPIVTGKYGKPFIVNNPLHFNISHSNDYAIFAFSMDSEIGVDIEYWRERKFLDGIIDANFSKIEQKTYHSLSNVFKIAGFYQGWTCNEAYIKATGMGLSFPLSEFSVEMDPRKPATLLEATPRKDCKTNWILHKLPCPKNYSAAIAVENNAIQLKLLNLELRHLG